MPASPPLDVSKFHPTGVDPNAVAEYRAGIEWLRKEIPHLQAFARAWTGKPIKFEIGPNPATDGQTIWLAPPRIVDGIEPDRALLANTWHEIAHVVLTELFCDPVTGKPSTERDLEHNVLDMANRRYGKPGGLMTNALEDGRVEERLYHPAPGARKHLAAYVGAIAPKVGKNCADNDDVGLMMVTYLRSAGYDEFVKYFSTKVQEAAYDKELDALVKKVHATDTCYDVMAEVTKPYMRRAKELGFFKNWDERAIDPSTGDPRVIDWNDLTKEEQDAFREQAKAGMESARPEDADVILTNVPDDVFPDPPEDPPEGDGSEEPRDMDRGGSPLGDSTDEPGGVPGSADIRERDDASDPSTDRPGTGGDGEESDAESDPDGDARATSESDGEPEISDGEERDAPGGLSDEERIEAEAKKLQLAKELERIEELKRDIAALEAATDTLTPPHAEYVSKGEIKTLNPDEAQIREAMKRDIRTGEIDHKRFVYKEKKVKRIGVTDPDVEIDKHRDVISGELNRLRAVFKQNEKGSFAGQYELGSHLKGSALPGFVIGEHLKPFDRKIKPRKLSYAVTLLIDQSGSMSGSKAHTARLAASLQAEMLSKLMIPFEVLGFTTEREAYTGMVIEHNVFKSFDEPWGTAQRKAVMSIEGERENLDGLALAWAWSRLKTRREKVRILMTYSDGYPSPDTDNQGRIMAHVLKDLAKAGAVAIGIGIQSTAVEQYYPKTVICTDVRALPRMVTKKLEEELRLKR